MRRGRARRASSASACDGLPAASRATFAGISFSSISASGATRAHVRDRDRERRGVANGVTRRRRRRGSRAARSPATSASANACAERLQRLRRQLLGDELDDERCGRSARHAAARAALSGSIGKPSASRESTYACATSRDSVRMRPMYAARSVTEIAPRASSRLNVCAALRIIS